MTCYLSKSLRDIIIIINIITINISIIIINYCIKFIFHSLVL